MRAHTLVERRRLYMLSRVIVARHYRRPLTLAVVARVLATSPRALQRAYSDLGETSFHEDLLQRRMGAAASLLAEQPALSVREVARLVGYRQASHFARAFRRRYGHSPARFRALARERRVQIGVGAEAAEAPALPAAPRAGMRTPGAERELARLP